MPSTTQGIHLHKLAQLFPAIGNLIRDDEVTEVMVVSHPKRGVLVFFEKKGKLHRARLPTVNKNDVLAFCHAASRPLGSNLNEEPLIDARLADGSRVAIAVPPAAPNGPAVTIRRFAKVAYTGEDLVRFGSLPKHVFDLLVHSLTHRGNVLVAGGTGSGKTTLLNALLAEFPEDDRLVVIEDVVELKVDQPNVVRLEARSTGANALKPRVMVKHALRQRPDHIVLGEVRGEEAYDVLQALNTGHGGSMTTIHANSAQDALLRLASCAMEGSNDMPWSVVAANVAMAFDLIVYQARRPDRSRGVLEVIRVKGYDRVREEWDVDVVWTYDSSDSGSPVASVPAAAVEKPVSPPSVPAPAPAVPAAAPPVLPAPPVMPPSVAAAPLASFAAAPSVPVARVSGKSVSGAAAPASGQRPAGVSSAPRAVQAACPRVAVPATALVGGAQRSRASSRPPGGPSGPRSAAGVRSSPRPAARVPGRPRAAGVSAPAVPSSRRPVAPRPAAASAPKSVDACRSAPGSPSVPQPAAFAGRPVTAGGGPPSSPPAGVVADSSPSEAPSALPSGGVQPRTARLSDASAAQTRGVNGEVQHRRARGALLDVPRAPVRARDPSGAA